MNKLDQLAVDFIHTSTSTGGAFEYLMAVFAVSFNNEIVAFVYGLGIFLLPYDLDIFLMCALLPAFGLLVTFLMKRKISRLRPGLYVPRAEALMFDLRGREKNHSMPSGDSVQATAFWALMAEFEVVSVWTAGVLAFLTMSGRVYYMCHYPTDTVLGALVGLGVFNAVKCLSHYVSLSKLIVYSCPLVTV